MIMSKFLNGRFSFFTFFAILINLAGASEQDSFVKKTLEKTQLWHVSNVEELKNAITALKAIAEVNLSTTRKIDYGAVGYSGGTIILAPGKYTMDETVEFNGAARVNIIGSGWDTVWKKNGNGDAIVFNRSPFVAIRNMKIIGDVNATEGSGIIFRGKGSSSCTVDYCRIRKFADSGVRFEASTTYSLSTNTVSNCHFIGNRDVQLYCFRNNDFFITGNQFGTHQTGQLDPNGAVPKIGVFLDRCSAGTYSRNYHWDNTVALKIGPGSNYNRIENNRFEESRHEGIIIGDANIAQLCIFNIFTGNTIHSNSKFNSGKFTAVLAYNAWNTTFCENQIFSWTGKTHMKRCLEVGAGCKNWIVKDNIMQHADEKPYMIYDISAEHIVKDNLIL